MRRIDRWNRASAFGLCLAFVALPSITGRGRTVSAQDGSTPKARVSAPAGGGTPVRFGTAARLDAAKDVKALPVGGVVSLENANADSVAP
jgi:hypothetical protein